MDNSNISENMNRLSQAISSCDGHFHVKINTIGVLYYTDRIQEIEEILKLLREEGSLPIDSITSVLIDGPMIKVEGKIESYPIYLHSYYTGKAEETFKCLLSSRSLSAQVINSIEILKEQGFKIVGSPSMSGNDSIINFTSGSTYNLSLVLCEGLDFITIKAKNFLSHSLGLDQVNINIPANPFTRGKISIHDVFHEAGLSWCIKRKKQ